MSHIGLGSRVVRDVGDSWMDASGPISASLRILVAPFVD